MSDLRQYYRQAVIGRIAEIADALARRTAEPDIAAAAIRRAAHSLRGSGGTYGFPDVSAAAATTEDAPDSELDSTARALLAVLQDISADVQPQRTVLIIDDDPEIALLLRAVLASSGREIMLAESAAAAGEILRTRSPDVILLDLMLPDADGRTVLRGIRERSPAAHVIVLSGKSHPDIERECLALGADEYIVKPFDPETLAARVTARLSGAAPRE
jgi:CheY-like chemotaxis protein